MNKNKQKIKKPKKKINWQRIILSTLAIIFVLGASVVGYFVWNIYQDTAAFEVERLYSGEASVIYDANGEVIYQYGNDEYGKRENVTYDQLPEVLIDAVLSAEDARFFEHNGFDTVGLTRAAIENVVTLGGGGGGSTITQQLIKQSYFPAAERTMTRKVSELFLAIEAENEVGKEEILTLYLNKIYFGRGINTIGVSAASKYYFNKDVEFLTLPEAALLAGTLNSPSAYDPYYNLDAATQRRDIVLDLMLQHGYITEQENIDAKSVKVENMLFPGDTSSGDDANMAYIDLVNKEVIEKTGQDPREVPMEIHTYLDTTLQDQIHTYVEEGFNYKNEDIQVGASIQSNSDGRIVAVIGGRDYSGFNLNRADVKQQPGSSLKPIIDYGAAYEYLDWSTAHTVEDKPFDKIAGYNPSNWDGSAGRHGEMSITEALKNSWNTTAIWTFDAVLEEIGYDGYTKYLEGFGIDMSNEAIAHAYAIGGWSEGLTPVELANMYATVANGGSAIEPHTVNYITYVEDESVVEVDKDIQAAANQAISAETAFMIRESQVGYMDYYNYAPLNHDQIRAKTGTTNWGTNQFGITQGTARDSWLTAYNPDYAVAIWMGYDYETLLENPRNINSEMDIAARFADGLLDIVANDVTGSFPPTPEGMVQGTIVKGVYPYVKASASLLSTNTITGWFKPGTFPTATFEDLGINNLSSFNATLNSAGTINVHFGAYDPADAATNADATDGTKYYGVVQYVVEIKDSSSGTLLHSETLSSPDATINYTPTAKVTVSGYYKYADANIKSNVLSVTIGEDEVVLNKPSFTASSNGVAIANGATISASNKVAITASSQATGSTFTITLTDSAGTVIGSPITGSSATITLSKEGTYRISVVEKLDGVTSETASMSFTYKLPETDTDSSTTE